jgi:hypothetical protein
VLRLTSPAGNGATLEDLMPSKGDAKFVKEFGPRRDALVERLEKAANVGEGPMSPVTIFSPPLQWSC